MKLISQTTIEDVLNKEYGVTSPWLKLKTGLATGKYKEPSRIAKINVWLIEDAIDIIRDLVANESREVIEDKLYKIQLSKC